ncbi:MAG: site-specific integrase, partial [Rubrobacteraceae bacterium]
MTHPNKDNLPQPMTEPVNPAENLLAVYLRTLSSPQTRKTYNTEIRMFLLFLEEELGVGLEAITAEDVSLYREHLIDEYAAATAAKKLSALRRFLVFTYMGGMTKVNPEA